MTPPFSEMETEHSKSTVSEVSEIFLMKLFSDDEFLNANNVGGEADEADNGGGQKKGRRKRTKQQFASRRQVDVFELHKRKVDKNRGYHRVSGKIFEERNRGDFRSSARALSARPTSSITV